MEYQKDRGRIAELNDLLRTTLMGGIVLLTRGVDYSPYKDEIVQAVRDYQFQRMDENNPYGENDFGKVTVGSEDYFFKIDYYDLSLQWHSPDKADPSVTRRVLTIMRADEY